MVNLTNKYVASVKPPRDKKYIRLWDDNIKGFGLRVTDKGVKSFFFEGRQHLSKKTKQVKIGRVGEMSVIEARAGNARPQTFSSDSPLSIGHHNKAVVYLVAFFGLIFRPTAISVLA